MLTYHGFRYAGEIFLKTGFKKGPNFNVAKFGYAKTLYAIFFLTKKVNQDTFS